MSESKYEAPSRRTSPQEAARVVGVAEAPPAAAVLKAGWRHW